MLLPTMRWTWKRYKCVDYELQKAHATWTQRRFSCYSEFHAKEWSSDRSPVWRSLLCVKFRVYRKNGFVSVWCVLECSVSLFTSSTLFKKWTHIFIWLVMNYMYLTQMSFFSPLSLFFFSYFRYQTNCKTRKKKIELKSGLWMFNHWE